MREKDTSLLGRLRRALVRKPEPTPARGPQVDLLRQRVAEKRRDADASRPPAAPAPTAASSDVTTHEPVNLHLPVRREPEEMDRAMPVELKRGPDPAVLALLESETAHAERVLPYRLDELTRTLSVAVAVQLTSKREQALRALVRPKLGFNPFIEGYVVESGTLDRLLRRHYDDTSREALTTGSLAVQRLSDSRETAPVLSTEIDGDADARTFVLSLLAYAIDRKARDIIISPTRSKTRLTLVTAQGQEELNFGGDIPTEKAANISRILKSLCTPALDALNTKRSQKGTLDRVIRTKKGPVELSARVNVTPNPYGEHFTIRVFDEDFKFVFEDLVTDEFARHCIAAAVASAKGVLAFGSPPGSGKSTLLRSILQPDLLPRRDVVLTIENPIEWPNPHVHQFAVTDYLSQDELLNQHMQNAPDRIMVGESTLPSTARLVFTGSRAGIQMFTTVHANSAALSVERFRDLGISRKEIAENVKVLVAQRLLPRTCKACRRPDDRVTHAELLYAQFHSTELDDFVPMANEGCDICRNVDDPTKFGVVDKIAIVEAIPVTEEITTILRKSDEDTYIDELTLAAIRLGMTPLRRAAIELYKRGEVPFYALAQLEPLTDMQQVTWWQLNKRGGFRLLKGETTE